MPKTLRIALFTMLAALMMAAFVAPAHAAPAASSSAATGTSGYNMSLTLPTYGKSGCMVCHGDPNLVRIKNGKIVSYYMDQTRIDHSAHAKVACTGCHPDYASNATTSAVHQVQGDWQATAKSSCKTCHPREWDTYASSVHGPTPTTPGQKKPTGPKPSCGDCHGGHYIGSASTDPAAKAALHASAQSMCGDCHKDYWTNYDDYYHGAAYRKGAADAPACWQCHGAHDVLPTKDPNSHTNPNKLAETCSKCHQGASDSYTQYATIIHRKDKVLEANPVYAAIRQTGETIQGALEDLVNQIRSVFGTQQAKAETP